MRKRLLLLTLLISFSVPVVAHNEFNGGVGSAPNFETIQEKRFSLITDRHKKAMEALDLKFQPLIDEFASSGSIKKMELTIEMYDSLRQKMQYRFNKKMQRINDRDGKRIEERDGKKVGGKKFDGKRVKDVKKKIKNAKKNKKANK